MLVFRWLRAMARLVLASILIAPVIALFVAVVVDRGPAGQTRVTPHLFPLALWLFDDFAWTCARNSVIFASLVSLVSLAGGGVLGWVVARSRFWGRGVLRGLVLALLVVSPAFLALGLGGLLGTPRPWPWPLAHSRVESPGVVLETWSAIPLWIVWMWSVVPWGVALVALVTSWSVERLEPSWEEAARLTGAGRLRAWRALLWPLMRPTLARAAALVFVFALTDPGAPLVLGLRRTLGFQIAEAAGRRDPFPAAAVWAVMTGAFGLAGWLVWRWSGGTPVLDCPPTRPGESPGRRSPPRASLARALALALVLAGWGLIAWAPLAGLVRLTIGSARIEPMPLGQALRAMVDHARDLVDSSVVDVAANSAVLGLEVMGATIAIAWLGAPVARRRPASQLRARVSRLIGFVPPLLQGVGFLAIPWLAGLASAPLAERGGWKTFISALDTLSAELDASRNPWIMLSFCVVLTLVPRFLKTWSRDIRGDPGLASADSAYRAAILAGASRGRAARLSRPFWRGRVLAGGLLVWTLGATNLTPALLFEPWSDGRTIAPAVVYLATGPADARSQAAILALCAVAINITALGVARMSSALPHPVDLD